MTAAWRSLSALAALALVAVATSADARIHSLTGNARFQFGPGFPIPIGFTPVPDGPVHAIPGATIRQHLDPGVPSRIVLDPLQLTAPASPFVLPFWPMNPQVFQLHTSLAVQFPGSKISFRAFGRTGATTVTFCPGNTVTPAGNPACNPAGVIPGLLRYTRTTHQFGGAGRALVQGPAGAALVVASPPPCVSGGGTNPACQAIFVSSRPPATPAIGAPFGASAVFQGTPNPGRFFVTATASGLLTGITPTGIGPGVPNTITSHGGPWTTGMLTVSNPAAVPPQIFVFSGSDGRNADGVGSLSLVAGSVSLTASAGPNANRGWLNLVVGAEISKTPAAPTHAVLALLALIALTGGWALRRSSRVVDA